MPRIPQYESPQVESRALPGARQSSVASPSLFGAAAEQEIATGRAMAGAGRQVSEIAAKWQAEDNETEAKALDVEFSNFGRDVLNGSEGDPSTGYLAKQGKTALDEYGKAREALVKKKQDLLGKASNDRVRAMLDQTFGHRLLGFRDTMDGHARQQRASHMKATSQLRVDSLADDMADNWADPVQHGKYLNGLKAEAGNLADMNGITDQKEREAFTRDFTSKGHARVLSRMLSNGYTDEADGYLKKHGAEMDGGLRDQIKEKVEAVGGIKRVQEAADAIMASEMPPDEMLAHIEKNYSGKEEQQLKAEVKTRLADDRNLREQRQANMADKVWQTVGRTGSLKGVSPALLAELDGREFARVKDYIKAKAEAGAKDIKTNMVTWMEVNDGIASGAIKNNRDLMQHASQLSTGDLKHFAEKLGRPDKVLEAKIDKEDFDHIAQRAGLNPFDLKKSEEERAALGELKYRIEQRINADQAAAKRPLSRDEKNKLVQREMDNEVILKGFWSPTKKPALMLTPEEQERAVVYARGKQGPVEVQLSKIPESERLAIIRAARRNGIQPTEQMIADAWVRKQEAGK